MRQTSINRIYNQNKNNIVHALKNVNLDFGSNVVVYIIEKSGSGKSTLLNILGGMDYQSSGE